jgi:hypothetical protein
MYGTVKGCAFWVGRMSNYLHLIGMRYGCASHAKHTHLNLSMIKETLSEVATYSLLGTLSTFSSH